MNLVLRAKNIVLQPTAEWPVIAAETTDTKSLFVGDVLPLAAIGPIATWLGTSLIGVSLPLLGTYRTPLGAGLAIALVHYVLAVAGVFVVGLIIDALAPTFGGEKNSIQAMKCAVYAYTPAWLAGIFHLIPALGVLALLVSLYSLYVLYLGLPVLMKAPKDRALGYTVVVVLCAIVLTVVLGLVGGMLLFTSQGLRGPGMFGGSVESITGVRPKAKPAPDSVLGKLDTLSKALEESGKKMDAANKKGDAGAAMSAAMEGIATMASGGKRSNRSPSTR